MFYVWLTIAAVMAILEVITLGLVSVWFCVGALITAFLTIFVDNIWWQLLCFFSGSGLTLYLCFGVFKLKAGRNGKYVATNADAIVGHKAIVLREISPLNNQGQIKIKGQVWSATTRNLNIKIPRDSIVKIVDIQGVKAIVELENPENQVEGI